MTTASREALAERLESIVALRGAGVGMSPDDVKAVSRAAAALRAQAPSDVDVERVAEAIYHTEGFYDPTKENPPSPPPVWVKASLLEPHSGDCTKQPWSCMRCHAEEYTAIARAAIAALPTSAEARAGALEEEPTREMIDAGVRAWQVIDEEPLPRIVRSYGCVVTEIWKAMHAAAIRSLKDRG